MNFHRSFMAAIALSILAFPNFISIGYAQVLSTEDVFLRSTKCLSPPVVFQVRVRSKYTATVYSKLLSDGMPVMRCEPTEGSETIMIIRGLKVWDVLPLSRILIDKSQIDLTRRPLEVLRSNEKRVCFVPELPENTTIAKQTMSIVMFNEKEHYQITSELASPLLTAARDVASVLKHGTRSTDRLLVEKQTLVPVTLEHLSAAGNQIGYFEYLRIDRPTEIADDLFELPTDCQVLTPKTLKEYYLIHEQSKEAQIGEPAKYKLSELIDRDDLTIVKDKKTGLRMRKGDDPEKMRALVDAKIEELKKQRATLRQGNLPTARNVSFLTYASIVALLAFAVLWLKSTRWQKWST